MEHTTDSKLFTDFKPVSAIEWEEKVISDLKGAENTKKLIWKTLEGFEVMPYYRLKDLKTLGNQDILPGQFPFIRGNHSKQNDWNIRQDIKVSDVAVANKKALDILMKGVNSLGFILDENTKPTLADIEKLCENIFADAVELNFISHPYSFEIVEIVNQLVKKYNRDFEKIYGSVDFDPLGKFALTGNFEQPAKEGFDLSAKMIKAAKNLPYFKVITINAKNFHNAGSSSSEELAFALAQGVNYLTQLTERGLSINEIAPRILFQFAIGGNYFMEIAKLRTARMLWAKIVKAYGPVDDSVTRMFIHSTTSNWNKTVYDPFVNLLRTTTESMASAIGGSDTLTVNPFNAIYEEPTEFSERIARNQQLLIKEESYLDKVADPAAGSYYIENLTSSLAQQSWKLFLEVQEKGGFLEAFRQGFIQDKIKETAQKRDLNMTLRKEILLGTNQYANGGEILGDDVDEAVFGNDHQVKKETEAEPLKLYRGAQAFERLRRRTEKYALKKRRPKVFLLSTGNLAKRNARAQFSANFFNCAGFEIITNNGFNAVEDGLKACEKSKAEITVVCSSDEEYASLAPAINQKLSGKTLLVIAGYPTELIDELKKSGFEYFIHVRSNVLETLEQFQKRLGIH